MKETGLMFKAPLVRATLAVQKTQTRRPLETQPPENFMHGDVAAITNGTQWAISNSGFGGGTKGAWPPDPEPGLTCPWGQPGDRIYVRETFWAWGQWETRFSQAKGRDEWHFVDLTLQSGRAHEFDDPLLGKLRRRGQTGPGPTWWKRPAS